MPSTRSTRRLVLLVLGALLLAFVGRRALRALSPAGWERTQARYNALARAAGHAPIVVASRGVVPALPRRLVGAIGAAGVGREERCVSCHLGMVLPRGYAEPPFAAHPKLACAISPRRAGCVVCHGGEGAALEAARAHGTLAGGVPLLASRRGGLPVGLRRAEALQAGCAACHANVRAGLLRYAERIVPTVAAGRAIYLARGCPSCHRLAGLPEQGEAGPALDGIGLRRSAAALEAALKAPPRPMPPVRLPGPERAALVLFLQAQRTLSPPLSLRRPSLLEAFDDALPAPSAAIGALWARRVGCLGCHRLGAADGGVPDLRGIAWVRSEAELRQALEQPHARFAGTLMPKVGSKPLREAILAWLLLQRAPLTGGPREVYARVCTPCHGPRRDPGWVVLSKAPPALHRGGKLTKQAFVETVRRGRAGTAMAPWGRLFAPAFVEQIYDALPSTAQASGGSR